ncbi:hypothetical protein MLGJGCBP_03412 [Rhodococcus sp. T7]|nr:hypothetical protein MLGJGCBP_03412 [Rhodococcus sp. T7]
MSLTAVIVLWSMSSTRLGSATFWIAITASTAWTGSANAATTVDAFAGFLRNLTVASTMTARVPSDPTSSCVRFRPATFLRVAAPVWMIRPSASTALIRAT